MSSAMRRPFVRRPFEGIRVVDMTHVLAGPFCTYQLGLLGADVVKVEAPRSPDCARGRGPSAALNRAGLGINYLVQGANKRAVAIDAASAEGKEILLRLIDTADVLVENFRAGALGALGLGPEELTARNPRLVYCSITGFGHANDRAQTNAYDNVIQAASGIVARTRDGASAPVKPGASFVDYASGYCAAFAIAAALYQRNVSGVGQVIDCSMFDTALTLLSPEAASALYEGETAARPSEAGLGMYQTADGLLMLGAFNVRQNARLWRALGRPDFAGLADWPDLWREADAMRAALVPIMKGRTAAEWEKYLREIGVPAERVKTLDEAVRMPHLAQRDFMHTLPAPVPEAAPVRVPVAAFGYAHGGPLVDRPPPRVGEHTDEILRSLGLDDTRIASLRQAGVVA
jgi:crotonobetainyl-CoA:carnitine CoA-transferase CaiB-like acyl-CoA transferase